MPRKTIYVASSDLPLYDAAAELGGGLSPAIATALRQYVSTQEGSAMIATDDVVELDVTEGVRTVRTRFRGSQVARLSQRHDLRRISYTAYRTARGRFAVYVVDRPDWDRWSHDAGMWEDPRTWSADFLHAHERTLQVHDTLDELCAGLPDDIATAVRDAVDAPSVHDLDI